MEPTCPASKCLKGINQANQLLDETCSNFLYWSLSTRQTSFKFKIFDLVVQHLGLCLQPAYPEGNIPHFEGAWWMCLEIPTYMSKLSPTPLPLRPQGKHNGVTVSRQKGELRDEVCMGQEAGWDSQQGSPWSGMPGAELGAQGMSSWYDWRKVRGGTLKCEFSRGLLLLKSKKDEEDEAHVLE